MNTLTIGIICEPIPFWQCPLDLLYMKLIGIPEQNAYPKRIATITWPFANADDEFDIKSKIFDYFIELNSDDTILKNTVSIVSFANKYGIKLIDTDIAKCLSVAEQMLKYYDLTKHSSNTAASDRKLIMNYVMQITHNIDLKYDKYKTLALSENAMSTAEQNDDVTYVDIDTNETMITSIHELNDNDKHAISIGFNPSETINGSQMLVLKQYRKQMGTPMFEYEGARYCFD